MTSGSDLPVCLYPALKALAESNRLRILWDLDCECRPVTAIMATSGLPQTLVSFHLRILREAGLVRAERRGTFIYYCLANPQLLQVLSDLAAELAGSSNRHTERQRTLSPAMAQPQDLTLK